MSKRSTLQIPLGDKPASKLAEEIQRKVLAPLPRNPIGNEPASKKRKPHPLYDPGAKPAVPDPMGAIVYGNVEPETVLARIRGADGHVSHANVKTASRPIDYLRQRSANPIHAEQFAAAEQYLVDREATGKFASNTAAVIDHMQNSVPWTQRDYDVKHAGDMMPYGTESKTPKDTSNALMQAAWRVRRIMEKLPAFERALIDDLVIRDYPVGVIAQRWGWSTDAAAGFVRLALWRLVRAYEETHAEFRAWLVMERQSSAQEG